MRRFLALSLLFASAIVAAEPHRTRNVILVTADGLRWQEVFNGVDPQLAKTTKPPVAVRPREALMPFLWTEVAAKGVILHGAVTNAYRVSYPGYSEILTGRAQDDVIKGNDPIQNPVPTVLEVVREKLKLERTKVALIGTWDTFRKIGEHTPGSVVINAGLQNLELPGMPARIAELNKAQWELLTPWDGERHDYVTYQLALEYLKWLHPRLMHIAFGETDDWAHDKRYANYLKAAQYYDACLRELWSHVDHENTTLVLTCDHGRGSTVDNWGSHGDDVEGADQTWIAVIGPDTPARGEVQGPSEVRQRDIAPTILTLFGIDPAEYKGVLGKPIEAALKGTAAAKR
jgi:hypothetical protein